MSPIITISAGRVPDFAYPSFPLTFLYSPRDTVGHLKTKIQVKIRRFYKTRQHLVIKSSQRPLLDETLTLQEAGVNAWDELEVIDLGPQLPWKFAMLVEYTGPFIIHPFFYFLPQVIYGTPVLHSRMQGVVFAMVEAHFVKRILETLFIHRYSRSTLSVPATLKNSLYYHGLGGFLFALDLYRPKYSATSPYINGTVRDSTAFLWICVLAWAFFQISNLSTHLTFRSLRRPGDITKALPFGYGFGWVSCPNYLFEMLAWSVICLLSGNLAAWLFFTAGAFQMTRLALKKHRSYKKKFEKSYPRGRKAIFPFVL
ncbi:hypothetical protein K435DRAFT_963749, partial [Dendrothele bispora CBS 962.96]